MLLALWGFLTMELWVLVPGQSKMGLSPITVQSIKDKSQALWCLCKENNLQHSSLKRKSGKQ